MTSRVRVVGRQCVQQRERAHELQREQQREQHHMTTQPLRPGYEAILKPPANFI